MEATIKLSRDEVEAMCIVYCQNQMAAPEGMKWEVRSLSYGEANCALTDDVVEPVPIPAAYVPTPVDPDDKVPL